MKENSCASVVCMCLYHIKPRGIARATVKKSLSVNTLTTFGFSLQIPFVPGRESFVKLRLWGFPGLT